MSSRGSGHKPNNRGRRSSARNVTGHPSNVAVHNLNTATRNDPRMRSSNEQNQQSHPEEFEVVVESTSFHMTRSREHLYTGQGNQPSQHVGNRGGQMLHGRQPNIRQDDQSQQFGYATGNPRFSIPHDRQLNTRQGNQSQQFGYATGNPSFSIPQDRQLNIRQGNQSQQFSHVTGNPSFSIPRGREPNMGQAYQSQRFAHGSEGSDFQTRVSHDRGHSNNRQHSNSRQGSQSQRQIYEDKKYASTPALNFNSPRNLAPQRGFSSNQSNNFTHMQHGPRVMLDTRRPNYKTYEPKNNSVVLQQNKHVNVPHSGPNFRNTASYRYTRSRSNIPNRESFQPKESLSPNTFQLQRENHDVKILFKKSRKSDNAQSERGNVGHKNQEQKSEKNVKKKVRARQLNWKKKDIWKKKKEPQAKLPPSLMTFSRTKESVTGNLSSNGSEDSADENASTLSRCSSPGSSQNTTLDDFVIVDSDDSSDTNESEDSSVFASEPSVKQPESFEVISPSATSSFSHRHDFTSQSSIQQSPGQEKFISVYWDIENCPVPSKKSAVDVVKKIRDTFYDGHTEAEFFVACDTRNLNVNIERELSEALVTVIHANSQNKNAADVKLQSFLQQFQYQYRLKNSAVVLVSGDSDFSTFLYDMRYKHHIYINLVCNHMARLALQAAAQRCIFYDDFIGDLPDRGKYENNLLYILTISNLPDHVKSKAIKTHLTDKIKSINGKVRKVSSTNAELVFPSQSGCDRAHKLLQGEIVFGNKIHITHEIRNSEESCATEKVSQHFSNEQSLSEGNTEKKLSSASSIDKDQQAQKKKKNKSKKKTVESENASTTSSDKENKKMSLQSNIEAKEELNKEATLYVYVSQKLGDVQYWEKAFQAMWDNKEISVQWSGTNTDGYFLVNFRSLSKAQKAKKLLQKAQKTDPAAPKFLKLVKEDMVFSLDNSKQFNLQQITAQKIEERIRCVKSKQDNCLTEFAQKISELRNSQKSGNKTDGGKSDMSQEQLLAFQSKMNELNEQKIIFLSFVETIYQKLKNQNVAPEDMDCTLDEIMRDFSRECSCFLSALPIYAKKNMIIKKIKKHQVVVLRAETGSGKSTQITQYLWREGFAKEGLIICTQPRKIAAVSIAKHVSSQVGCAVGNIVGYQVGLSQRKSSQTKILYVTDFTMLKMCASDSEFKDVSCIIIDEAHERSIYTDLLLGMVKRCLKSRPDLRVIVTSATIDISIFQNYFDLKDDSILQISGRTFPVEDIWLNHDVKLEWNYLDETINAAYRILEGEPGDVLAFLVTPFETEKAVQIFNDLVQKKNFKSKLLIHQLHGKLDLQEQQKVFEKTPIGARKIVFSTNCAETSVTIPGIKYVIDCGMVKEAQYDAVRNLNVLAVGFVNRSSAEQRRGRAGRTQSGKCFRLYSKSNYEKDMAEGMTPEILRVNLGHALLKLMELGVKNPVEFDFVVSPPLESLMVAMKQLIHLGAVHIIDHSLTEMGSRMARLPVEPRLCYLVLTALEKGVGYEAVVVAALATVSRNIFFRNTENKKEADAKKFRFCQSESDFLTFLEVYKEWTEVPKAGKSRWCVLNCINARSMRAAHDLVSELILTLSKELDIKLVTKFSTEKSLLEIMQEIIFFSFSENLCIFSGHYKVGYLSPSFSGNLFIHPSSSLFSLGQWRPKYVVYDTILKTTQTFLLNLTPVSDSIVENAVETGRLQVNLNAFKSLALEPYVIAPLGELVLRRIVGKKGCKKNFLEQSMKKMIGNSFCAIDANFNKGELTAYVVSAQHNVVEEVIFPVVEEERNNLLCREHLFSDFVGVSDLGAVVGAGAKIKEILFPGEFREVSVITKTDCDLSVVLDELQKCGDIYSVRTGNKFNKVTFSRASSAVKALEMFKNEKNFSIKPAKNYSGSSDGAPFYKVLIKMIRRQCVGQAFISVEPDTCFPEVSYSLQGKSIYYMGMPLKINLSRKIQSDICISNLPPDIKDHDLRALLSPYMPPGVKINKLLIVRQKEFPSSDKDIEKIKYNLINSFTKFTPKKKITIDIKPPKPKDIHWSAVAFFENPHDGQIAVNALKGLPFNICEGQNTLLNLKPVLETSLYCNNEIFKAIQTEIDAALKFFNDTPDKNDKLDIEVNPSGQGRVVIRISSNNIADINDARNAIFKCIQGDQIQCSGTHLEKLFTVRGKSFLADLQHRVPSTYVHSNFHSKVISIFSSTSSRGKFDIELNSFFNELEKENFEEICLRSESGAKGLFKEIIKKYGYNLNRLQTLCKLTSAEINIYTHVLTVTGREKSIIQCKELIDNISEQLEKELKSDQIAIEECPVCTDEVQQCHRLEYCGHAYCKECIIYQLQNIDVVFPLACCKEGCHAPFVLDDILWAMKETKELDKRLHSRALDYFVEQNIDVQFCPTPDCPSVYRVTSIEEKCKFYCPCCSNTICTKCCVHYHEGMSCDLYQHCKINNDYSLQVWLNADSERRKLCPSCKVPIEKNGGCNHMTCWKCKCHMCWLCLKIFPTGDMVYLHQSVCTSPHKF